MFDSKNQLAFEKRALARTLLITEKKPLILITENATAKQIVDECNTHLSCTRKCEHTVHFWGWHFFPERH